MNYYDVQVEFKGYGVKFKRDLRHVPAKSHEEVREKVQKYYETYTSLLQMYKIVSIGYTQEAPFLDIYEESK